VRRKPNKYGSQTEKKEVGVHPYYALVHLMRLEKSKIDLLKPIRIEILARYLQQW